VIGGAHLSAGHREGLRRCEVRRFPAREAAIGQSATDARPAGPAERPRPSGERGSGRLKKKMVAAGPKDRMGRLAAGPIGLEVKEKFFSE
jgi:hypothetical protein